MAALPKVSGGQAVRAFAKAGWEEVRQRGSQIILVKTGHLATLSVPDHRELAKGTRRSLLRTAGMSVEAFIALLD